MKTHLLLSIVLIFTIACGNNSGGSSKSPSNPPAQSNEIIEISPQVTKIAKGTSVQLKANMIKNDDTIVDITALSAWTSDNPEIAYTAENGLFIGNQTGTAVVTATYNNNESSLELNVTDATITSITINPPVLTIPLGATAELTATAIFSDQSSQTITDIVNWSAPDPDTLQIEEVSGKITTNGTGVTRIAAKLNDLEAMADVTVTDAVLNYIEISPVNISIPSGTYLPVKATGIYSDSTKLDLSKKVAWHIDDTSILEFHSEKNSMKALTPGKAVITASYDGLSVSSETSVTEAVLQKIKIEPVHATVARGLSKYFFATGIYSDNTKKDISDLVIWNFSEPAVALISNAADSKGVLHALKNGSGTITASKQGISGNANVEVSDAILQRLELSAAKASIPSGLTTQLTARGLYSDNSVQLLTGELIWETSDSSMGVVSNSPESKGLFHALKPGSIIISAKNQDNIIAKFSMTITDAILMSIDVSPSVTVFPNGSKKQFTAIGLYSDNSTNTITSEATWTSSDLSIAVPDNTSESSGLFTALSTGTTTITAQSGLIQGTAGVDITDAVLTRIIIESDTDQVPAGHFLTLNARGVYSDSSIKDLTSEITWISSNDSIATISNAYNNIGEVSAISVGSAVITGLYEGVVADIAITVTNAVIQSITLSPGDLTLAAGTNSQLIVTGIFSDGSTQTITDKVIWNSSVKSIASINEQGIAYGLATGITEVSALFNGISSRIIVLEVSEALIESIEISAQSYAIPTGITTSFTSTAFFSDGSLQDVTKETLWQIDDKSLASISNLKDTAGQFHAFSPGESTITAVYKTKTDSETITIYGGTLNALRITPPVLTMDSSKKIVLKLEGLYTLNDEYVIYDLTEEVYWIALDKTVISISNLAGTRGEGTALSAGTTKIAAVIGQMAVIKDLEVLKDVETISIIETASSVPVQASVLYSAQAQFSDGSSVDVTDKVLWTTSDKTIARPVNAGEYTGITEGNIEVGISMNDIVYDTVPLSVTQPVIKEIRLTASKIEGGLQFGAIGLFDNELYADITQIVSWSSDPESVIMISNEPETMGKATVFTPGVCTVTATAENGIEGDINITITPPEN